MRAYKKIREVVLQNALVIGKTQLQLADVNSKTIDWWHKNRTTRQEQAVLKQGIQLTTPPTNPKPAPPAKELPPVLDIGTNEERHQCPLPANTAGQSKPRPQRKPVLPKPAPMAASTSTQPMPPYFVVSFPPAATPPTHPPPVSHSDSKRCLPYSTKSYRKRKEKEAETGMATKRYKEREGPAACRKCNNPLVVDTHPQFYGYRFCPNTGNESLQQWSARVQALKHEKDKKQTNKVETERELDLQLKGILKSALVGIM